MKDVHAQLKDIHRAAIQKTKTCLEKSAIPLSKWKGGNGAAIFVQQMMVEILRARFLAEEFIPNDAVDDRGSDMSDCTDMELTDDETGSGDILCDIG